MPALAALLAALLLPAPAAAEKQGELAATVRVLVQNVYGRKENDCKERYKALAAEIAAASPPFDVVALNEHWSVKYDRWFTCDASVLTAALEAAGYKGKDKSVKHTPSATEFGEVSGGNSVFTRHRITASHDGKYVNGRSVPLSGYLLTRVEVAPGVDLDVWTVHLEAGSDGCDEDCRHEQADDTGMALDLWKEKSPALIVGDLNTGGPMTAAEKPPYAGNAGYEKVMEALGKPRDLWLELSSSGTDEGFTYDCVNNTTQSCKYRERIDYVLLPPDNEKAELVVHPKSVSVVRWKTATGVNVSDHYGLDATLELRRRPKSSKGRVAEAARAKVLLEKYSSVAWD